MADLPLESGSEDRAACESRSGVEVCNLVKSHAHGTLPSYIPSRRFSIRVPCRSCDPLCFGIQLTGRPRGRCPGAVCILTSESAAAGTAGRGSRSVRPCYARPSVMNFCNQCGARVAFRIPEGDHLSRHVCEACGAIHYENPKLVVGCVPVHAERILLCRRAIEPRRGYWTVPAGFMENGETLQQAAARESFEEALARVEVGSLLSVVHVLHAQQVHVFFRAKMTTPEFGAGVESLEAVMVEPNDIPWSDIAFPSTDYTLKRYLEDRAAGRESHYFTELDRRLPK